MGWRVFRFLFVYGRLSWRKWGDQPLAFWMALVRSARHRFCTGERSNTFFCKPTMPTPSLLRHLPHCWSPRDPKPRFTMDSLMSSFHNPPRYVCALHRLKFLQQTHLNLRVAKRDRDFLRLICLLGGIIIQRLVRYAVSVGQSVAIRESWRMAHYSVNLISEPMPH